VGKIFWGVQIEEPHSGRKVIEMRNLAGLKQQFDGKDGKWTGKNTGGLSERTKAVVFVGVEAGLKLRERFTADHGRKGLNEGRNGNERYGRLRDGGVMNKICDQGWGQEREIYRKKDSKILGADGKGCADAGERTAAGSCRIVLKDRRLARLRVENALGAYDAWFETGFVQDLNSVDNE